MKTCEHCDLTYERKAHQSATEYAESRYCSRGCASRATVEFRTERQMQRRVEVCEDVEWILDSDSPENVARRLGYKDVKILIRMCERWERRDLAARLRARLEGVAA